MIYEMFAIRDNALGAYNTPIFVRSKGEAIRSFTDAANDEKSQLRRHSSDYTLFYLGKYDDSSGIFEPIEPSRVIGASEVIIKE